MKPSNIKSILIITLTNIGDVILTFPVIDQIIDQFPNAHKTVIVGDKASKLFDGNKHINEIKVYNKRLPFLKRVKWSASIIRPYDLVIDLRNTFLAWLIPSFHKSNHFFNQEKMHMHTKHLRCLQTTGLEIKENNQKFCIDNELFNFSDKIKKLLDNKKIIAISPGAADEKKRWPAENFLELMNLIHSEDAVCFVLVGSTDESEIALEIEKKSAFPIINTCGKFKLNELGSLYHHFDWVISNDSAASHMGSYLNKKVMTIFGPTNETKYGPWSTKSGIAKVNQSINQINWPSAKDVYTQMKKII